MDNTQLEALVNSLEEHEAKLASINEDAKKEKEEIKAIETQLSTELLSRKQSMAIAGDNVIELSKTTRNTFTLANVSAEEVKIFMQIRALLDGRDTTFTADELKGLGISPETHPEYYETNTKVTGVKIKSIRL